ncbi:hypothetical protein ALC56_01747 [Trachymyrmex septentrionalis]|uniref:Uncharacterized protein n=1 Tax=Trachymyrmex septentrionalis TaxID=34720 RepID=A0A195FTX0_9HYME|nr:hypothetical protein ALC56_01747 [Trachymyrmex septentrionalis]
MNVLRGYFEAQSKRCPRTVTPLRLLSQPQVFRSLQVAINPTRLRNHPAPNDKPIAEINVDDDLRATFDLSELFECGP